MLIVLLNYNYSLLSTGVYDLILCFNIVHGFFCINVFCIFSVYLIVQIYVVILCALQSLLRGIMFINTFFAVKIVPIWNSLQKQFI